jgi:peptidoglycan/LPS O-acetylase OafA/YrhL
VSVPRSVAGAAAMFVVYGLAVLLNAIRAQGEQGWSDAGDFGRAVLRLAGCALVAWGLLRGERWAWWLGLALAVLWLAAGAVTMTVLERGDVHWLQPSNAQLFLAAGMIGLGLAVALLLTPSARRAFRRPR